MKKILLLTLLSFSLWAGELNQAVQNYNQQAYTEAFKSLYTLADGGNAKAQFNLAQLYATGKGVTKDAIQAQLWYEKSAKQGNGSAQFNLAHLYQEQGKYDTNAYKKAIFWYEKAVVLGIAEAYNNLATLYLDGLGIEKDQAKALALFEKSAKSGNGASQINLAILYAWGEGIKHDKMKAYENLKLALKGGRSEASGYIGKLCKESAWVCKD